jgi:imidazolonepropionase-like amidohydrolase
MAMGPDGKPVPHQMPTEDLDGPQAKELIATMKAHHTVLDATLVVYEGFRHSKPMNQYEPGIDHVAPQLYEALNSPPGPAERTDAFWKLTNDIIRTLHAAGISIVAGTDQSIPGYSLHREMEIYVQDGFTPLEAIQSATIEAAKALGVQNESGSLEVGKRADVLLLDADPLADIHNTRKVWRTVAAGAVYDPAPLWTSVGFKP